MASASRTLFIALSRLLALLFLIHESQSCPNTIQFNCPDYKGKKTLDYPFIREGDLPDCGVCLLTCEDNHTMISFIGNPELTYRVLDINPSNNTIVAASYQDHFNAPCGGAYTHSNATFPNPPSVSFKFLDGLDTIVSCPNETQFLNWDNHTCKDDDDSWITYGPYNDSVYPQKLPPLPHNCSSIQLPHPEVNFSIQYNLSTQCMRCVAHGGRCHDDFSGEFYCYHKKGETWKIILGTVFPGSIIIILVLFIIYRRQRKKKSGSSTLPSRSLSFNRVRTDLEVGTANGVTVYSYTELEEATNKFDTDKQLGEGGFGVVYHGILRDGREVAVKRLYEKSYKRIEQFLNEIRILTNLRHQNLVTLYGCTSRHTRELLLVYEYIPNGTVADHLHGEKANSRLLPWPTRMSIAIETATALSYLHYNDIIHRDVKTNNILLDNNFSVKVADFGLSRLFPADVTHVSTAPQGTPGYVDPEYHQCYHLTNKSDVYSFGVVLIELISSLLAVDVGRERHDINLSNYAMSRIQSSALSELVDPNLGFETDFKVRRMTTLVAELASQCLQHDREVRPSMKEVLETLKNIAGEDYEAIEAEETNRSTGTTHTPKPPPSPTDNDKVELLRGVRQPPPSPVSVMDKWLGSSKSTTPNTSKST